MSKTERPLYCWDSTTFIAWLKEEESAPLGDIALVVREIDTKEANLLIPATVFSEILEAHLDSNQKDQLEAFLMRSNVVSADLTVPISRRAAAIRDRGLQENPKRKLKTPDAQILATALAHHADALHTLDPDLLKINGHPTAEGQAITRPIPASGQRGLG
jgi:predicted nucleic acid-binding protein